jgi:hypothetical protein
MQPPVSLVGKNCELYKLTDSEGFTRRYCHNETKWSVGCTNEVLLEGNCLCSPEVLHAYINPYIAVILNSTHAAFDLSTARMFKAIGVVVAEEGQLKVGVKKLTITEEMSIPKITTEQKDEICIKFMLQLFEHEDRLTDISIPKFFIKELKPACEAFLESPPSERELKKNQIVYIAEGHTLYLASLLRNALCFNDHVRLGTLIDWCQAKSIDYVGLLPKEMQ